jgi:hydrogenase maturation protein HypF
LFYAVAAIIGLKNEVSFEAQAAIELESLAVDTTVNKEYNYSEQLAVTSNQCSIISTTQLIREIWKDKKAGVSAAVISAKFHLTLAEIILELSRRFGKIHKTKDIALSGGCFQNRLLLALAIEKLKDAGFKVHFNKIVPANDGGISLGQAYVSSPSPGSPLPSREREY